MANTLNLNTLPEYVNEHKDELLVKASLGGKTLGIVDIMPNVKYKDAIPMLESEVVLADGTSCGWNPQGSDTVSERTIEVHPIAVDKEFCVKDFRKTFMNYQLKFEAGRETMPFEEKFAESNLNAISDALEVAVWQGNTAGITGFVADAQAEGTDAQISQGATATDAILAVVSALTARMLKKGVNIYVSPTTFRQYVVEQNSTCCANSPILDAAADSIVFKGDSRIAIVPVDGLEGASAIVAATKDALVYGTDVEGSENVYKMWLDDKDDKMLFKVHFVAGTALRFPDEVVYGILS